MSPQGWCPPAPSAARASERPRAMTADVIPDRRVTVPTRGLDPAFVDGSRLYWALPSRVHEGFWFRASSPTGYKVMRCFPHVDHGPVQDKTTSYCSLRDPSSRPRNSCAVLAAVKAWPVNTGACRHDPATASLDRSCARRRGETRGSGRRNGSRSNKETIRRKEMTLMGP